MKKVLLTTAMIFTSWMSEVSATPVSIKDYDWQVTDVAELGLTKEEIFTKMDRKFIKLGKSICANRALMWLHDMKQQHNIDGGKIFLFYTGKTGGEGLVSWWYHVAPVIAENDKLFVMDAAFGSIKSALTLKDWMGKFATPNCKEIQAHETDLLQLMNSGRQFPTTTKYGTYDCYYKVVPAGPWFPASVAHSLTGGNVPNEIQEDQVYSACLEAVTDPIGRFFGVGKKPCNKYLGR